MGLFSDLFSTKPAENAAAAKAAGYSTGNATANDALTAGQTSADASYDQAYAPFASLIDSTGRGAATYADATGVNGQGGIDRAGSTFKSLPGYSGGLTTGIDAVNRGAAARGLLGSGNTSADEIKFASDYDANKYGSFVSALAPYLGANQSAVSGGATVLGAKAGADLGVAGQKAQYGYQSATGTGNANADAALAPYSASQNFWSALMGAGKLAVSAATGMPTGGGGSMFGGGTPDYGQTSNVSYGGQSMPMFGRAA